MEDFYEMQKDFKDFQKRQEFQNVVIIKCKLNTKRWKLSWWWK